MRLEHVSLSGFKRLAECDFYVNRKLVALVGPNEAGKSSILQALQSLENADPIATNARTRTRSDIDENSVVVSITYRLNDADRKLVSKLPIANRLETVVRTKSVSGQVNTLLSPPPRYPAALWSDAGSALEKIRAALSEVQGDLTVVRSEATGAQYDAVTRIISTFSDTTEKFFWDNQFQQSQWNDVWAVRDAWSEHNNLKGVKSHWAALQKYYDQVFSPGDLNDRALAALGSIPSFLTFGPGDRELRDEYQLAEIADDSSVPQPLANLFELAELSLGRLMTVSADEPLAEKEIGAANRRLAKKFQSKWKQARLSVFLKLQGTLLKVFVQDTDTGAMAFFNERSDGLRMFVAIMLFLEHRGAAEDSILLIDEADMHLHLDAQADLVSMLTALPQVSQVIYTTHSPGCLPSDLGTGVRFVIPNPSSKSESIVVPFFWSKGATSRDTGLLPMLFMMGARSSAFSRLRRALIAEGQTEAILLPSLIRLATGVAELDYQVVPGLSEVSSDDFEELASVAVNVSYLSDGDGEGDIRTEWLLDRHVPSDKLFRLPKDMAIEDLLDRDYYLRALNEFLPASRKVAAADLAGSPIKSVAGSWAKTKKAKMPGPVVVAELMLTNHESGEQRIELSEEGVAALKELHSRVMKSFSTPVPETTE